VTRRRRPAARRWLGLALTSGALLVGCAGSDKPSAVRSAEPTASVSAPAAGEEYVDATAGFAITFPADWEIDADAEGVAVRALPPQQESGFADNVAVITDSSVAAGAGVAEYLDTALSSAPTLVADFRIVRREVADDLGIFEFTATAQGTPIHVLAGVVVVAGKAHVASFTATPETYGERSQVAEQVVRSLRVA